jgi:hypothetical protein
MTVALNQQRGWDAMAATTMGIEMMTAFWDKAAWRLIGSGVRTAYERGRQATRNDTQI